MSWSPFSRGPARVKGDHGHNMGVARRCLARCRRAAAPRAKRAARLLPREIGPQRQANMGAHVICEVSYGT